MGLKQQFSKKHSCNLKKSGCSSSRVADAAAVARCMGVGVRPFTVPAFHQRHAHPGHAPIKHGQSHPVFRLTGPRCVGRSAGLSGTPFAMHLQCVCSLCHSCTPTSCLHAHRWFSPRHFFASAGTAVFFHPGRSACTDPLFHPLPRTPGKPSKPLTPARPSCLNKSCMQMQYAEKSWPASPRLSAPILPRCSRTKISGKAPHFINMCFKSVFL